MSLDWNGVTSGKEKPFPTPRSSHMTFHSPSSLSQQCTPEGCSILLPTPSWLYLFIFSSFFLQGFICLIFPAPRCFGVNGERRMRTRGEWAAAKSFEGKIKTWQRLFLQIHIPSRCLLTSSTAPPRPPMPFSLMGAVDVNCLFIWGCEGTHFDHIKPWMWLGHTHKSGLLFEDGVIKLFPHILILWSFGRERSRRVKRQTGHTGKMLRVSCLSFIWVEGVFLTLEF